MAPPLHNLMGSNHRDVVGPTARGPSAGAAARDRGFALVLTLMLLVMAGAALAGVSRTSLSRATAAQQAEEDLQRRWATLSVSQTLLAQAPRLVTEANEASDQPLAVITQTLTLGGQDLLLHIADEQAKFNMAARTASASSEQALAALRRLLQTMANDAQPRLALPESSDQQSIGSFEQLLVAPTPGQLFGDQNQPGLTQVLTLWGDGRVNFSRAAYEVLDEAGGDVLGAGKVHELAGLRRQMPGLSLARAMALLELGDDQQAQIAARLTDRSTCYSVHVQMRSRHRRFDRLSIIDSSEHEGRTTTDPRLIVLAW